MCTGVRARKERGNGRGRKGGGTEGGMSGDEKGTQEEWRRQVGVGGKAAKGEARQGGREGGAGIGKEAGPGGYIPLIPR